MEFIFRKVLKVVFELLEAEPRLMVKGVVSMDVGLVWVCQRGEEDIDIRMKEEYEDSMGVFRGCGSVGIPIGFQAHLLSLQQTATCCCLWGSSPIDQIPVAMIPSLVTLYCFYFVLFFSFNKVRRRPHVVWTMDCGFEIR